MINPYLQNPYFQQIQQTQERNQSSFIPVRTDKEVLEHPVAPGNTVYFKNETKPYIYIKTMGQSQFDIPQAKKYKLTEEPMDHEENIEQTKNVPPSDYLVKDDLKPILEEIENIKGQLSKVPTNKDNKLTQPNAKEK